MGLYGLSVCFMDMDTDHLLSGARFHRSFTKVQRLPAEASSREADPGSGLAGSATLEGHVAFSYLKNHHTWCSYGHLPVITGYFYGIIHSINGVISTYN